MIVKLPKVLQKYADQIDGISDERSMGDGYWVELAPGWLSDMETHQVHEDNPRECARVMKWLDPCQCDECKQLLAKRSK
jgi:hypothetical protein